MVNKKNENRCLVAMLKRHNIHISKIVNGKDLKKIKRKPETTISKIEKNNTQQNAIVNKIKFIIRTKPFFFFFLFLKRS